MAAAVHMLWFILCIFHKLQHEGNSMLNNHCECALKIFNIANWTRCTKGLSFPRGAKKATLSDEAISNIWIAVSVFFQAICRSGDSRCTLIKGPREGVLHLFPRRSKTDFHPVFYVSIIIDCRWRESWCCKRGATAPITLIHVCMHSDPTPFYFMAFRILRHIVIAQCCNVRARPCRNFILNASTAWALHTYKVYDVCLMFCFP